LSDKLKEGREEGDSKLCGREMRFVKKLVSCTKEKEELASPQIRISRKGNERSLTDALTSGKGEAFISTCEKGKGGAAFGNVI